MKYTFLSNPIFFIEEIPKPIFTCMILAGINPKNVAKKKYLKGTPTIGEAKLINQLGSKGVILRNNKKKNKLSLFCSIKFLN